MEVEAPPPADVSEALHELHARFLNLPKGEAPTVERIFFQIQQAHWYYEDEWADYHADEGLPHLRFEEFSRRMFETSPMLQEYCGQHREFKGAFKDYMASIPKYGCILLNSSLTHVLLVCGIGAKNFSFPKGKVNQGEAGIDCAARETYEETGYNPRHLLSESMAIVHGDPDGGFLKLYVAAGVPDDGSVSFAPVAKKEVGDIAWIDVASMDGHSGYRPVDGGGMVKVKVFRVAEFIQKAIFILSSKKKRGGGKKKGGGGGSGSGSAPTPSSTSAVPPQGQQKKGAQHQQQQGTGARPQPSQSAGPQDLLDAPLGAGGGSWSVKDMFNANAALLGVKFVYDGNPHTFGDDAMTARPTPGGAAAPSTAAAAADAAAKKKRAKKKGDGEGGAGGGGAGAGVGAAARARVASATDVDMSSGAEDDRRVDRTGMPFSVREPFRLDRGAVLSALGLP
jgi:8-oxo-dGTP pyrophosphatase MutT (NUDIX family)